MIQHGMVFFSSSTHIYSGVYIIKCIPMRLFFFGGGGEREGRRNTVYDDVTPPKKMYLQARAGEEA